MTQSKSATESRLLKQWEEITAQLRQSLPNSVEGQDLQLGERLLELLESLRNYDRLSKGEKAELDGPLDRFYSAAVHTLAERPLPVESSSPQPQKTQSPMLRQILEKLGSVIQCLQKLGQFSNAGFTPELKGGFRFAAELTWQLVKAPHLRQPIITEC